MKNTIHRLLAASVAALCLACPSFATIANATVWEVRTAGSATNGGGFKAGASGSDWSQQNSAQYSVTDGVTAGTTTITSATASFGTDVVGNIMYVQGGTGSITAGWYEITARTNATTITVDRSTGLTSGTGVTLHIGGAISDTALVAGAASAGNTVYVKSGTYSMTSTSANVAGGRWNFTVAGDGSSPYRPLRVIGYGSVRGDNGTKPLIQASGISSLNMVAFSGANSVIENIDIDGATLSGTTGLLLNASNCTVLRCKIERCTTIGLNMASSGGRAILSSFTGNSGVSVSFNAADTGALYCEAYANTASAFQANSSSAQSFMVGCLAYSNTGGSTHGFSSAGAAAQWTCINCTAYANGGTGFRTDVAGASPAQLINCLAVSNTGPGYGNTTNAPVHLYNCAGYNNASDTIGATSTNEGFITLSADPFTAAGSNDFSLNNTSGGGAALKALGFPSLYPRGTTASYPDVGAAQAQTTGTSAVTRAYGSVQ